MSRASRHNGHDSASSVFAIPPPDGGQNTVPSESCPDGRGKACALVLQCVPIAHSNFLLNRQNCKNLQKVDTLRVENGPSSDSCSTVSAEMSILAYSKSPRKSTRRDLTDDEVRSAPFCLKPSASCADPALGLAARLRISAWFAVCRAARIYQSSL